MPCRLLATVLIGLLASQPVARPPVAPTLAVAPAPKAASTTVARVERARLVANVAALPTKRSARADDAHLDGLYATQALIERRLKELGLVPALLEVDFIGSTHDKKR